jgi:hypothetical protein
MMAHNVYQHIESVQRANSLSDAACALHKPDPSLWQKSKGGEISSWVPRNLIYAVELVDRVFQSETPFTELDNAQQLLAELNGKKTLKSTAEATSQLFELVETKKKDFGNDNDSSIVESWDEEDADEILKRVNNA